MYGFLYYSHTLQPLSAGISIVTNVSSVFILVYPFKEEMCVVQYFNLADVRNREMGMKGRKKKVTSSPKVDGANIHNCQFFTKVISQS